MNPSICGVDCTQCPFYETCAGCAATDGRPFGGDCVVALCCQRKGLEHCDGCPDSPCTLRQRLVAELNELGIADMEEVTSLVALNGSLINLEYTLPTGQTFKLLDDNNVYLGSQLRKADSDRHYGVAADEKTLLVCEYGEAGADAEIVVLRRRN